MINLTDRYKVTHSIVYKCITKVKVLHCQNTCTYQSDFDFL